MARQAQNESRAVATITELPPPRLPVAADVLAKLAVSEDEWRVLCDQTFPSARDPLAIMLALRYCAKRNLDVYKKVVHVVPVWSTALNRMVEGIWPGIAELRTTASRTGVYGGIDLPKFGPMIKHEFVQRIEADERDPRSQAKEIKKEVEYPEYVDVTVYKMVGGQRCPFHARVYWMETYATAGRYTDMPNSMWMKRPRGQLEKCGEAAALRRGFPEEIGGELSSDEMYGKVIDHEDPAMAEHVPPPQKPLRPPRVTSPAPTVQEDVADDQRKPIGEATPAEIVDADVAEEADPVTEAEVQFFDSLQVALADATTAKDVEAIWADFKPAERFATNPESLEVCEKMRSMRIKRIERK